MSEVFRDNYKYTDEELDELFKKYCTDFTENARNNMYDPITGRDREIQEMILILLQNLKYDYCLHSITQLYQCACMNYYYINRLQGL